MIYAIRHLTAYAYEAPVAAATLSLRLTPRDGGGQKTLDYRIEIAPAPESISEQIDFYGNIFNLVSIGTPHTYLRIIAEARVDITVPRTHPGPDQEWNAIVNEAGAQHDLSLLAPANFMFASPHITFSDDITKYVRASFPPGRGIIEACTELIARIRQDFLYAPAATAISTLAADAFAQRRGVCQDFAHIMIAGLRALGLPAAYVSGYLRTIPPPGMKRLEGADATHAWVSVWTGARDGWIGFDPTNAIRAGNDHITLAIGRDFSDVSPVHGVFVGSGKNALKVEVDVIPVSGEPG